MARLDAQIKAAAGDVAGGEVSLGDALRKHFPTATSGDESPGMGFAWQQACTEYIEQWARWNVSVEGDE